MCPALEIAFFMVKGSWHQIRQDWAAIRQSDLGALRRLWWMV